MLAQGRDDTTCEAVPGLANPDQDDRTEETSLNICVIPARGNSQRIPRKNIRDFWGKPIIAYSIETAIKSALFGLVVVSTDDKEIEAVARDYGAGVWWRQPDDGTRGTQEVMREVLDDCPAYEHACCLYPTAPMLQPKTLLVAMATMGMPGTTYVVPVGTWLRDPGQFYMGLSRAFGNVDLLGPETRMLPIDPKTECDINVEADWIKAEQMYAQLRRNA